MVPRTGTLTFSEMQPLGQKQPIMNLTELYLEQEIIEHGQETGMKTEQLLLEMSGSDNLRLPLRV